jgi:uracil-DNA glycosylase
MRLEIKLPLSWREPLAPVLASATMTALGDFLAEEAARGATIFPPADRWFAALDATPLDAVRVVILGQDPYHGDGQAHGLAFSVPPGVRPPPSLANIFKELAAAGVPPPTPPHGCLESWAEQGVLLLNTVLTVRRGEAGSHAGRGWEAFTDAVVRVVSERGDPSVFMLWGRHAAAKATLIDGRRHCILTAPHPSPLSARTGFFGCRHFALANIFLVEHGRGTIDWRLPNML